MSSEGTTTTSGLAAWLKDTLLVDAKENRQASEQKWNVNRAARYADSDMDPKGTWKTNAKTRPGQSDTFFDITKQKVVSTISLLTDTIFKDGRVPFMCSIDDEGARTEIREADPEAMDAGDDATEHAEARLRRQLRHCKAIEQYSKCVDDGATYGEYWTHRYSDQISSLHYIEVAPEVWDTQETMEDTLAIEYVTLWEMYRDMEVQDIHAGQYVIRAQQGSAYDLRGMVTLPLAIPKNIKKALKKQSDDPSGITGEFDNTSFLPPRLRNITNRKKNIEIVEFWCLAPMEKVEAFQRELSQITGEAVEMPEPATGERLPGRLVPIFAIMADEEIIAFEVNPGKTPYNRGEFEPNNDNPDGVGVSDNMAPSQKVLNGAIRSYEDNTKLIANFILLVRKELLADKPEENWFEGAMMQVDLEEGEDMRNALYQPVFQDITATLQSLITMFLEFADMASHVPRAEQGHQNANPQTAFELQQRLEKAGKYMGNVIKRLDEVMRADITEMHDYNMRNPAITDGKGDFSVIALGFDSFQNRYIRLQKLIQLLTLILSSPDLTKRAKLRYLLGEIAKAQDMEPDQLWKSSTEIQEEDAAQMESQQAQIDLARAQLELATLQAKAARDNAGAEKDMASAQKILADIQVAQEELRQSQERLNLDRAQLVADVEDKIVQREKPATKAPGGQGES